MKRTQLSALLAGVLAMALAACSSTADSGRTYTDTAAAGVTQGGGSGATNSTSDSGTTASSSTTDAMPGAGTYGSTYGSSATGASGAAPATATSPGVSGAPNSTVTGIEVVQRQPGDTTSGSTSVGGSNTSGSTGTPATGERMYRVTVRMDDGRSMVMTQDWAPAFRTGDRVRVSGGVIQH